MFPNSFEERKMHFLRVFECFRRAGIAITYAKYDFAQPSLDFVGFEVAWTKCDATEEFKIKVLLGRRNQAIAFTIYGICKLLYEIHTDVW